MGKMFRPPFLCGNLSLKLSQICKPGSFLVRSEDPYTLIPLRQYLICCLILS